MTKTILVKRLFLYIYMLVYENYIHYIIIIIANYKSLS